MLTKYSWILPKTCIDYSTVLLSNESIDLLSLNKYLFWILCSTVQLCGVTEDTEDIRTQAPWIVSIYVRLATKSKRVKFLTTGLVTSPTVVTSFFGGTLSLHPINYSGRRLNQLPGPQTFLIVAGLNSTNLQNIDQFTEFIEVNNIYQSAISIFLIYLTFSKF